MEHFLYLFGVHILRSFSSPSSHLAGAVSSVVVPGVTPASLVGAGSVLSPRSDIGGLGVSMVESVLQGSPTGKHYETINDQIIKENGGGGGSVVAQQPSGGGVAGAGEKMDNGGVSAAVSFPLLINLFKLNY